MFDNKDKNNKFVISENRITRNKEDFLYVRPLGSFLDQSLLVGIEDLSDLYFCRHEDIKKIEVYNSKTKEVIHCGSVYDSQIIEAIKTFQEEKKANKTNKEKQEASKPKKELNIEWIKEIYPKVKTKKEFISFIKEIGEEYNKETGTGWVLAGPHPDNSWEYRKANISQVSVSLGADKVSFNKEGEFLFAQNTIKGSDVITNQYSSSLDPNWIRLRTETYCKGFNLITGDVLTVDRGEYSKLYEIIKNHIPVLKLKIDEVAPKNYTGIIEMENQGKPWCKEWRVDGKLHRIDGPAREYENGEKYWFSEGNIHRENGPAAEFSDGTKIWYIKGKCHRIDGPAIEYSNGDKEWWIDGIKKTKEEFDWLFASKAVKVITSDAKEVAKRLVVIELSKFIHKILSNSIKSNKLKAFLESTEGKAIINLMIGATIPILKQHLSSKYEGILDEISYEFRIQGETEIVSSIVDRLVSSINFSKTVELLDQAENFAVRVDIGSEENGSKTVDSSEFESEDFDSKSIVQSASSR